MKVGDLVRHWWSSRSYGFGVIIEIEQISHTTNYKVLWSKTGESGWYENDRLVSLCK